MDSFKEEIVDEVNELLERFEKLKEKLEKGPRNEIDPHTFSEELKKYNFNALNNGGNLKFLSFIDLNDKDEITIGDKVYKKNKKVFSLKAVYYTIEIPFNKDNYDFITKFVNKNCLDKQFIDDHSDEKYNFDIYISNNDEDKHKMFDLEKDNRFRISNYNENLKFIESFIEMKKQE